MEVDGSDGFPFNKWGEFLGTPAVKRGQVLSYISDSPFFSPHPRSGSQRLQVPLLRCLLWNLQAFHVATERWGFHGWSTYTLPPNVTPLRNKGLNKTKKIKGKQWLRKVMGIPGSS